jgi:hypothetical protein
VTATVTRVNVNLWSHGRKSKAHNTAVWEKAEIANEYDTMTA